MQEKIAKFESLVAGGMRPGRAARRVFSGSDAEIQSLAQLAGLRFSVSGDYSAFEAAYHDVRSCMQGKGALCHQFYSLLGVVIATLADERGVIVARALLAGHLFYQVYGDKHHVLEALLIAGGYSVTEDWLSGRHFVLKKVTEPRFCSEITLGGVVRELVSPRNVRHFLRRGWRVETFNGLIPTIKVWRGVEVTDVRSEDLYEFIKAGWLSVSTVPMWHITPTREMGRVNRYERFQIDGLPQGETPWVDGYGGHNPECLFKAEEPESEPWHRYEHFEEEFA